MEFTIEKIFFDTPIYTPIEIKAEDNWELQRLDDWEYSFEGYNPWQKIQSTFKISRTASYSHNDFFNTGGGYTEIRIKCKRYDDEFRYYVIWSQEEKLLIKIGQYPSVADFHLYEIKQYKKLLPDSKLKEFTKAIGLAANGVGIGSFVYLRRIFEHLIDEAYQKGLKDKSVTEENFQPARMDNKIELLKNYLPEFMVSNKNMYSILSLGIHELDENTCLAHFDTLRVGIEIVLDEKLDELKKKEKVEKARKKIQSLKTEIKK